METSFLKNLIESDTFSLTEKIAIFDSQFAQLPTTERTVAENALAKVIKEHYYSQYGGTEEILALCTRIFEINNGIIFQVHKAAVPYLDLKSLSLEKILEQIKIWQYFGSYILPSLFEAVDWKKINKDTLIAQIYENSCQAIWSYLISHAIITPNDLQKILFSKEGLSVSQVETTEVLYNDDLVTSYGLPEALLKTKKLPIGYKLAALDMIYKTRISKQSIFSACQELIGAEKNEKNIAKIAEEFGHCQNEYEATVLDIAIHKLSKPRHLLKLARLSGDADNWEAVMKKFELEKSDTKRILRFAKISGLPAAWYLFYNQRDHAALAPPHAELMRVMNKFESVALEAILLPYLDYEKFFPEDIFNFLERYKDILADEEEAERKDPAMRMTHTCLVILTSKINWSRLSYDDQIAGIKALQYDITLQAQLAAAIQHITRQDFLKLVEQGYLMHPTLYGKILLS